MELDVNVLIAISIFAMVIAYILILRKLRPESTSPKKVIKPNPNKTNSGHPKEERKYPAKEIRPRANPSANSDSLCFHEFGYLGTLPRNSKIPDECLGCSRIVKCLATGRSRD